MTPANLTECLQWLEDVNSPDEGPAYAAFMKAGFMEAGANTSFAVFVVSKVADFLRSHLAQSPLREAPAPFDWTDPGHRLTEGDLDAAEETYMGETVKSGTYRHRAALEAVIRGYLASNRAEAEPLTVPGPEIPPIGHPLQVLGGRLADLLDEDQWNNAEPLLLAAWKLCRPQPEAAPASRFLSGDSHGRVLSHDEGGYTYTRGGKLLFQASHGSRAIDLWPDATTKDMQALIFALASRLLIDHAPSPADSGKDAA